LTGDNKILLVSNRKTKRMANLWYYVSLSKDKWMNLENS